MRVILTKLPVGMKHKYKVTLPAGETVRFGAQGYSDYTIHRDANRMKRYLSRHRARENWTRGGVGTAGWWSRWLLWSEPGLSEAKRLIYRKFNIKIV